MHPPIATLATLLACLRAGATAQSLIPPVAPSLTPSIPLAAAAAGVLASLIADGITGDLPSSPLARARCEDGVAALFPGRVAMVNAGLKDPCAILVREAARQAAQAVSGGGGQGDVAALASGAPAEGGGLRTPTPTPTPARVRVNVTGLPPARAAPAANQTAGLIWVRRNETQAGDVVVVEG